LNADAERTGATLEENAADITRLRAREAALQEQIAAIEASTVRNASMKNATTKELQRSNAELSVQLKAANAAHAKEVAELTASRATLNDRYNKERLVSAKFGEELAALQRKYDAASNALGDPSTEDLAERVRNSLAELEDVRRRAAECNEQLEAIRARVVELEEANGVLAGNLATKEEEMQRLRAAKNVADDAVVKLSSEKAELTAGLGSTVADVERLAAEVADLKVNSNTAISKAKTTSAEEAAAKVALTERLTAAEAARDEYNAAATNTAAELAQVKGQLAEAKASAADMEQRLKDASEARDQCEEALAGKNNELAHIEQTLTGLASKAAELEESQAELAAAREVSESLRSQLESIRDSTAANVAAAKANASTAQKKALDDMEAQLSAANAATEQARASLATTTEEKDATITALTRELEVLRHPPGYVRQRVVGIEEKVAEQASRPSSRASSPTSRTSSFSSSASFGGETSVSKASERSALEIAGNYAQLRKPSALLASTAASPPPKAVPPPASVRPSTAAAGGGGRPPAGLTTGSAKWTPASAGLVRVGGGWANPLDTAFSKAERTATSLQGPTAGATFKQNPLFVGKKPLTEKRRNNYKRKTRKNRK
jgi:chromosome segregation ATPase